MTKPDSSLIAVVMDRSGSMGEGNKRSLTIEGFNTFITEQRKQPGECRVYYTQFDTEYDIVHENVPIQDFPDLTFDTFVPRGGTALYDAIGRTIIKVGENLKALPEEERPSNVIFVIQTDGQENSSKEFTRGGIVDMIALQRDVWKWNFLFLGAGLDAVREAQNIGVAGGQTLNYSGQNTRSAFKSASSNVAHVRSTGHTREFTEKEREDAS